MKRLIRSGIINKERYKDTVKVQYGVSSYEKSFYERLVTHVKIRILISIVNKTRETKYTYNGHRGRSHLQGTIYDKKNKRQ